LQVGKCGEIDPSTVKCDVRINDSAISSRHEDFLRTIRMQEYQVGTGLHLDRTFHFWTLGIHLVTVARHVTIDDIVAYTFQLTHHLTLGPIFFRKIPEPYTETDDG
jgi:hypothetical protein